ncbi:hypothetical protein M405DRAFT_901102 [Rhizopogon salebrosus TDB-379]|nr:hypothetical protein M405DRAFT_901102 [Rhizopogon salebrosus TDB-379]
MMDPVPVSLDNSDGDQDVLCSSSLPSSTPLLILPLPFTMDIHQLLMSLNVSDIRGLTFHHLMAFVRLVCMAKPFIHQRKPSVNDGRA